MFTRLAAAGHDKLQTRRNAYSGALVPVWRRVVSLLAALTNPSVSNLRPRFWTADHTILDVRIVERLIATVQLGARLALIAKIWSHSCRTRNALVRCSILTALQEWSVCWTGNALLAGRVPVT